MASKQETSPVGLVAGVKSVFETAKRMKRIYDLVNEIDKTVDKEKKKIDKNRGSIGSINQSINRISDLVDEVVKTIDEEKKK